MDASSIADRIVGLESIHSDDILDHELNPRTHGAEQKSVLHGVMSQVGVADTLSVYKSKRNGDKWVCLDGHMRKNEYRRQWKCIVLDVSDDEADLLIQAFDQVGSLAEVSSATLRKLRERIEFEDKSVRMMLEKFELENGGGEEKKKEKKEIDKKSIPEMELRPYEHYDYVMLLCRTTFDWNWLVDKLGLAKVRGTNDERYDGKVGLGRAVPADKLIAMLKRMEEVERENRQFRKQLGMPVADATKDAPPPAVSEADFQAAINSFK